MRFILSILSFALLIANEIIKKIFSLIQQVLSEFACRSAGFLQTFAILFNSSTLIAISVDRYRCVVQGRGQPFMLEWQAIHTAIYVFGISALCLGKVCFLFFW